MRAASTLMVPQAQFGRIAGLNQALFGAMSIVAPAAGAALLAVTPLLLAAAALAIALIVWYGGLQASYGGITIGGIVNLIYLAILFYFFIVMPDLEGMAIGSLILYAVIWGAGIAWYFYWKHRNRDVGVDVNMTFGELPPDSQITDSGAEGALIIFFTKNRNFLVNSVDILPELAKKFKKITKRLAIHASPTGGTQEQAIDPERQEQPALTDAQVVRLAQPAQHFAQERIQLRILLPVGREPVLRSVPPRAMRLLGRPGRAGVDGYIAKIDIFRAEPRQRPRARAARQTSLH